ncbi:twin-arginine translocation signal domain-containing protein [Ramlibacter sp.]|uniref:twin-arginine translocation signal domain-containing protein n=1 Tax=Ramlibacter sp. TaxID=1917967 RepID=UPI00342DC3A8
MSSTTSRRGFLGAGTAAGTALGGLVRYCISGPLGCVRNGDLMKPCRAPPCARQNGRGL